MGKRGRPKKDPFEALDTDFKDAIASSNVADIRNRIAKIAMDQVELMKAKSEDEDLRAKVEEVKIASEQYREGTKLNKLRIMYAKQVLEDKGG